MGQYYSAYVQDHGVERVFCPQNAIFMARNGIDRPDDMNHSYDMKDQNSWGSCYSGMKLMEHSWLENDFVNGVLESIWDNSCRVAWVGDYADDIDDFDEYYTEEVYESVWGDYAVELPFDEVPSIHSEGFIVNHDKGLYIDLAKYAKESASKPRWSDVEWCIHPLPILTCVGNGRGGGDYHGTNMDAIGSWCMDLISFRMEFPSAFREVDYSKVRFIKD